MFAYTYCSCAPKTEMLETKFLYLLTHLFSSILIFIYFTFYLQNFNDINLAKYRYDIDARLKGERLKRERKRKRLRFDEIKIEREEYR